MEIGVGIFWLSGEVGHFLWVGGGICGWVGVYFEWVGVGDNFLWVEAYFGWVEVGGHIYG